MGQESGTETQPEGKQNEDAQLAVLRSRLLSVRREINAAIGELDRIIIERPHHN